MIHALSLHRFDALSFFEKLSDEEAMPTVVRHDDDIIIAWNPSLSLVYEHEDSWKELEQLVRKRRQSASAGHGLPFVGGMIGYISYEMGASFMSVGIHGKKLVQAPLFAFHVYDQALVCRGNDITAIGDEKYIRKVREIHARQCPPACERRDTIHWTSLVTRAAYEEAFTHVAEAIKKGDVYQLNLAYPFHARSRIDHRRLFCRLCQDHRAPHAAYFSLGETSLLSLSPERFMKIDQSAILTCPIKGTRRRGLSKKEDEEMAQSLLSDPKEEAELAMITDLLRNDLGQVSATGSVRVTVKRALQKNPSVWHTYAQVESRMDPSRTEIDVFRLCMPGGSVTGCPKKRAMEYIDQLEKYGRGPYCGALIAFSDHGMVDSSILIRTIIAEKSDLYLHVGGGIVADSQVEKEWEETRKKAENFLHPPPRELWMKNGIISELSDHDHAFLDPENPHSFGVFETMRAQEGVMEDLSLHLARLEKSARIMHIILPQSCENIAADAQYLIDTFAQKYVRIRIVATRRDVFIHCRKMEKWECRVNDPAMRSDEAHADTARNDIVSLMLSFGRKPENCRVDANIATAMFVHATRSSPDAKALPCDLCVAARKKAEEAGCMEALLVAENGDVPEGAYTNIFWLKHGVLHTPHERCLLGIMRDRIVTEAKRGNIPMRFVMPSQDTLREADAVFLTNAIIGCVQVRVV